ncbi:jupiter microtubule associated homolog 2 [Spea bombifrons]|uniref:jupiter microtubule associated homolog 2 n=1 Tax=Spea bombifrons TaxID=233779 RepID=UPI00234BCA02|nr:jupiter microtubule associated homolog 2 [Spea bombifrons]
MTSTHTFLGLESDSKPSSRVLKPPGGGSSCIFGGPEESAAPTRSHRMTSNIFGTPAEPQNAPKRSNPPGGKPSGIFADTPAAPISQRAHPSPAKSSNIFADGELPNSPKAHPNKPKDNITLKEPEVKENTPVKAAPPAPAPKEEKPPAPKEVKPPAPDPALAAHEPHLGPRPRSHNRVLNPPGGKSSVTFY